MRRAALFLALFSLAACGAKEPIRPNTVESYDVPGEIAVEELKKLLPTCDEVLCTLPSASLRRGDIREWLIDGGAVWIKASGDPTPLILSFFSMKQVELDASDRPYSVKVYTRAQRRKDQEHFAFVWRAQEPARRALELLEAVRTKQ